MSGDTGQPPQAEKRSDIELVDAVRANNPEAVVDALQRGANINFQGYNTGRMTALHHAVNIGSVDITRTLLRWGANPDTETIRGYTPLYNAMTQKHPRICELLLDYGANPDTRPKSGTLELADTLLHEVTSHTDTNSVIMLMLAGGNPLVLDKDGKTPRERISGAGGFSLAPPALLSSLEMSESLPNLPPEGALTKAALFAKNDKGKCVLDNPAAWRKLPEMLSRLKEAGEEPFTKAELLREGANGYTYLERASQAAVLGAVVADFNARGESFTVKEVLETKGMQRFAVSDQLARAIFTPQNTAAWTPSDLRGNLALLTEDTRGAVKNFAQLSLAASRNSPTLKGIGR